MSCRLLKVAAVAALLEVSEYRVYEMWRRGELPVVRIGRFVRARDAALDRWIAMREETGGLHPNQKKQVRTRLPRRVRTTKAP